MLIKNTTKALLKTILSVGAIRSVVRWSTHQKIIPHTLWRHFPVDTGFALDFGALPFTYMSSSYDSIGRVMYWGGKELWESESTFLFSKLAERAHLMLDIGANTGIYSLITLAANPGSRIIAFEPVPRLRERLSKNIEANGWMNRSQIRVEAVSSEAGRAQFHVPDNEMPTTGSLHQEGFQGLSGQLMDVELTTADAAVPEDQIVDLIKMDIEGFEDKALLGMHRILSKDKPIIMLECNEGGPDKDITDVLRPYSYRFFHIQSQGLVPLDRIQPDPTGHYRNFLCVPDEKIGEVTSFSTGG